MLVKLISAYNQSCMQVSGYCGSESQPGLTTSRKAGFTPVSVKESVILYMV